MNTLAVLTSGGDAPGMNAAIRSVVRSATQAGRAVYGIPLGYEGLLYEEWIPLATRDVGGIVNRGGTMLKTARCDAFRHPEVQAAAVERLQAKGVDGLVVIGGDGSMAGASALSDIGFPTVTIPGTIDNDMNGTDYTIGFDTAVNSVVEAVGKIRDTTVAHERTAVVEVMGRTSGHIAVRAGLACGAEIVLIPERNVPLDTVCGRLNDTYANGKRYSIVLVAEGAYSGYAVADFIRTHTELEPNVTVLGYLQRGGAPTAHDAVTAAKAGAAAVEALRAGRLGTLVACSGGRTVLRTYEEARSMPHALNIEDYELISALGRQ